MGETNDKDRIQQTGEIVTLEQYSEELTRRNPGHPFTETLQTISEAGKDVYTHTFQFSLSAGVLSKSLLTLGAKVGAVDLETHNEILEAFKPLQHVTNMGMSYAIIGASVATGELVKGMLEESGHEKAGDLFSKAMPVLGTAAAIGAQLLLESKKVVPWDTLDPNDALAGILIIGPGLLAARHFVTKNLKLKEMGAMFAGKFKKTINSPQDEIAASDIEVVEVVTIQ